MKQVSFVLREVFHSGGLKNERAKKLVCERVKTFFWDQLIFPGK